MSERSNGRLVGVSALACALAVAGCAAENAGRTPAADDLYVDAGTGTVSQPVINGRAEDGYLPTAYLARSAGGGPFCSAVLIAPRVVLTAAHCVDGDRPPGTLYVGFGQPGDGPVRRASVVVLHPRHVERDGLAYAKNDFALILLRSGVTDHGRATIATPASGCDYRSVGYGRNSDGRSERRSAPQCVGELRERFSFVTGANDSAVCYGDSGGPLYLEGTHRLVGLSSRGRSPCQPGVTEMRFTRPDAHRSFIRCTRQNWNALRGEGDRTRYWRGAEAEAKLQSLCSDLAL